MRKQRQSYVKVLLEVNHILLLLPARVWWKWLNTTLRQNLSFTSLDVAGYGQWKPDPAPLPCKRLQAGGSRADLPLHRGERARQDPVPGCPRASRWGHFVLTSCRDLALTLMVQSSIRSVEAVQLLHNIFRPLWFFYFYSHLAINVNAVSLPNSWGLIETKSFYYLWDCNK